MTALILEGGGMRGLFTAGALDAFLDADIKIPRCYGVSAGACNAISYYTGQRGRSRAVNVNYVNDKRYVSWENLLDGGVADSIPAAKAIKDGADKLVIILTQHDGYQKQQEKLLPMYRVWYHDYPSFVRTASRRHIVYNQSLELIRQLEKEGKAIVIRPPRPVEISRVEKDVRKLNALYQEGYNAAFAKADAIREFLGE